MKPFFTEPVSATELLDLLYENDLLEFNPREDKRGRTISYKLRERLRDLDGIHDNVNSSDSSALVTKVGRSWQIHPDWFFDETNMKTLLEPLNIKLTTESTDNETDTVPV